MSKNAQALDQDVPIKIARRDSHARLKKIKDTKQPGLFIGCKRRNQKHTRISGTPWWTDFPESERQTNLK